MRAGEDGGKPARGIEESSTHRVAAEGEVSLFRRHHVGQGRLLERRKRAQVDARDAEHPGHAGQDEQDRLRRIGEVKTASRHQQPDRGQGSPPAGTRRQGDRPKPCQGGSREADTEGDPDQQGGQA